MTNISAKYDTCKHCVEVHVPSSHVYSSLNRPVPNARMMQQMHLSIVGIDTGGVPCLLHRHCFLFHPVHTCTLFHNEDL